MPEQIENALAQNSLSDKVLQYVSPVKNEISYSAVIEKHCQTKITAFFC